MVTAEGRGKQDSWVLLLFLLTLGELFQHPETQLLHLKNKKVTVRQNYSLCPEIPEEIQVLSLSCSQCWGGILQWRLCPGTHGAGAQKLVFSFTKWKGWSDEFAKKSSSFASANPLLLTVLFLLSSISALLAHEGTLWAYVPHLISPFQSWKRFWGPVRKLRGTHKLLLDPKAGVRGEDEASLSWCTLHELQQFLEGAKQCQSQPMAPSPPGLERLIVEVVFSKYWFPNFNQLFWGLNLQCNSLQL